MEKGGGNWQPLQAPRQGWVICQFNKLSWPTVGKRRSLAAFAGSMPGLGHLPVSQHNSCMLHKLATCWKKVTGSLCRLHVQADPPPRLAVTSSGLRALL
eukprot:1157201-Pelagomonas_calceolata.AAC.5